METTPFNRTLRRRAVLLAYGGTLVLTLTRLLGSALGLPLFIGLIVLSLAASGYGLTKLFYKTELWKLGNSPDKDLDERQIRVRDVAYRFAYSLTATFTFLGLFYVSLALDKGLWLPRTYDEASTLMWAAFVLLLTLPSAVLAWTEAEI
jgi:hypothetical protein